MVTPTDAGRPRIFGKQGERSVLLDDPANVDAVVDLLKERHRANEVLRLGVMHLDDSDFSFLRELPFLQYLRVGRCAGSSIAAVQACTALRWLFLDGRYGPVDLASLPHLEQLALSEWDGGVCGWQTHAGLRRLEIHKAKAQSVDDLALPAQLMELRLLEMPLQSLHGIERLQDLRSADFGYAPGLMSINGLDRLPQLRRLCLKNLKGLSDYGDLTRCVALRELEIVNCGSLRSISWLRGLSQMRSFVVLDTDIADGDLSAMQDHAGLLWGGGTNKRHFKPSMKVVEDALRSKRLALGFDSAAEAFSKGLLPEGVAMGSARGLAWVE